MLMLMQGGRERVIIYFAARGCCAPLSLSELPLLPLYFFQNSKQNSKKHVVYLSFTDVSISSANFKIMCFYDYFNSLVSSKLWF